MTTKPADDFEAVRILVSALEHFDSADRERIIRWAREKLGMTGAAPAAPGASAIGNAPSPSVVGAGGSTDIKTFIQQKQPRSDNHLAAVVAYFHRFEAPQNERKDAISKEELVDACRKADRKRPSSPAQVLVNAFHAGLLDRGERGQYRLNSVGENLVAMVLPDGGPDNASRAKRKLALRKTTKKKKRMSKKTSRPKK